VLKDETIYVVCDDTNCCEYFVMEFKRKYEELQEAQLEEDADDRVHSEKQFGYPGLYFMKNNNYVNIITARIHSRLRREDEKKQPSAVITIFDINADRTKDRFDRTDAEYMFGFSGTKEAYYDRKMLERHYEDFVDSCYPSKTCAMDYRNHMADKLTAKAFLSYLISLSYDRDSRTTNQRFF
jgi:hypothetical protein